MLRSFRAIRFGLMVGIGGGAPYYGDEGAEEAEDSEDEEEDHDSIRDIRLGDVVVSLQTKSTEAVVQYDFGKSIQGGEFFLTGKLNKPPSIVLSAVSALRSKAIRQGLDTLKILKEMTAANPRLAKKFVYQGIEKDRLFKNDIIHLTDKKSCKACCGPNDINLVRRTKREDDTPQLHYGTIGSADQVMKDAKLRDKWAEDKGIFCFEMEAAGLMDSFPCLVIRGICDYADSHKNKVWQPYAAATAAAYAKELLHVIPGQQVQKLPQIEVVADNIIQRFEDWREADKEEVKQQRRTEGEERCLQALRTTQYELQKNFNPARGKDTCLWCLEDPVFLDWRDRSTSRLLWLTADPGCGKSVLSKALVDERLIEAEGSNTTICYFFFKDTFASQRSPANALSALLHQLFSSEKGARLIEHAMPEFRKSNTAFANNYDVLWSIVHNIARDPRCGKIVFLVDALDECEGEFQEDFINKLKIFEDIGDCSIEGNKNFKIFITSRPYWNIEKVFLELIETFPNIRLQGERESGMIRAEIDRAIEARVAGLKKAIASPKTRDLLLKGLLKVKNRTYLWVYLIFKEIELKPRIDSNTVERLLQELPETVQEAYEKILRRSSDPQNARRLLHIIVGATRPLSLREIGVALYITKEIRSRDDLEIQEAKQFEITIRDLCGLFINIIDGKVFLIHQTAKEFLVLNSDTIAPLPGTTWKQSLNPKTSNLILAECCLWYLSFEEFKKPFFEKKYPSPRLAWKYEGARYISKNEFLDYSAQNWFTHFNGARNIDMETKKLALIICDVNSDCFKFWFTVYWETEWTNRRRQPEWNQTLFVTAYFGLGILTALLLEEPTDFNLTDSTGRTPLIWSAERGHETVVKILLEAQADVNKRGGAKGPGTALRAASSRGHEAVVKMLLEAQADVNVQECLNGTALYAASRQGHEAVVKTLLEAGADVNARDGEYGTALYAASQQGHEAVVKILLEAYADVNAMGGQHNNALYVATLEGHEAVVRTLLGTRNVEVDLTNKSGSTPLCCAIVYRKEAIARMLLGTGKAEVDFKNKHGNTPLSLAAFSGNAAIVKMLLDTGKVEVDLKNKDGDTPLSMAAMSIGSGKTAVIKMLLDTGKVDVNSKNNSGDTPLFLATRPKFDSEAAGKVLLEYGANIEVLSEERRRELGLSIQKGDQPKVRESGGWDHLSA
ncbi:ankyrin repeat-containing protein [Rutstroemia sp. NJR-2017a WRK4]|nr:ankyrin repeat-containing protein [Rutstroemia sp. NJR-2017a WRK4]